MSHASNKHIIDKSKEIKALKQKYGERYFTDSQAIQEAAKLWGFSCNAHGVITDYTEEQLVKVGGCEAKFYYATNDKGHVLVGLNFMTAICGSTFAPSVFDTVGFADYHQARLYAIEKAKAYFLQAAKSENSCSSESNKRNAFKAAEQLKSQHNPQLTLF